VRQGSGFSLIPEGCPENSPAIYRRERGLGGLSSEGTAEDYGLQTSAVPAGRMVVWPGFPAINRRAIVGGSYGTSQGVLSEHLPVSLLDKSFILGLTRFPERLSGHRARRASPIRGRRLRDEGGPKPPQRSNLVFLVLHSHQTVLLCRVCGAEAPVL